MYKGSKKAEKVHLGSFTATDGHYFQSEEPLKPPLLHIMKIFLKTSSLEITVIGQLGNSLHSEITCKLKLPIAEWLNLQLGAMCQAVQTKVLSVYSAKFSVRIHKRVH